MLKNAIDELLTDREKVHGDWKLNARIQTRLKEQVRLGLEDRRDESLPSLNPWQVEALEMICVKMARIIAGDPSFADHWLDICGYAKLGNGDAS